MGNFVELTCPFCAEKEFDAIGLKKHLLNGWCEPFEQTAPVVAEIVGSPCGEKPDEKDSPHICIYKSGCKHSATCDRLQLCVPGGEAAEKPDNLTEADFAERLPGWDFDPEGDHDERPEPPAKLCSQGGECGYLDGVGTCIKCGEPHPDPARAAETSPCRIFEYDGSFKCLEHNRLWGAVSVPDEPCAGWKPDETDAVKRCRCGRLEWESDAWRITCGDGSIHYTHYECIPAKSEDASHG